MTPPDPWIGSQKKAATLSAPSSRDFGSQLIDRAGDDRLRLVADIAPIRVWRRDMVLRQGSGTSKLRWKLAIAVRPELIADEP